MFQAAGDQHDAALARAAETNTGAGQARYQQVVQRSRGDLRAAAGTDAALATVLSQARQDHATAREMTRQVVDAARADSGAPADSPAAQREAIRRKVARLRAQHAHVSAARRRAARRARNPARAALPATASRAAVRSAAVAAAEHSRRLGCPSGAVAIGQAVCLGCHRAGPVRLFGVGAVVLPPSRYPARPHHLRPDQQRRCGATIAGPTRRPGVPARRSRTTRDRQRHGGGSPARRRDGADQPTGRQHRHSAAAGLAAHRLR